MGQGGLNERYSTLTISYAIGDNDGRFTSALIRKVSETGVLNYRPDSGELSLGVTLIRTKNKNIGFRYDRNRRRNELLAEIVPTETRRTLWCEIVVIETCSGKNVIGPVRLSASVEFDHDYYSSRDGVNVFSLGQLGDIDAAYEACLTPLYQKMAEKVADYINNF
jgi:hypothetical protein